MKFLEALDELEQSQVFLEWQKDNTHQYLAHGFTMVEPQSNHNEWQIGYYCKDKDLITVFAVSADGIKLESESEVFKKDGKIIEEIKRDDILVTISQALQTAEEFQKQKYPTHIPMKKIIILQHLPEGQIWNITYVTQAFTTLNMKVETKLGEVISDEAVSLIQMTDPQKLKEELQEKMNQEEE